MKHPLDEWLASRPTCPDCGEKLHKAGYCPGRRQIRPEALQHPTQTEKKEHTMSNAIVTKQIQPGSKPGEVVDTSAAKVVPPSSEVKTETASREVAEQSKATQAKVNKLAKKMTGGAKAPKAAAKGKSTKAKPAAKSRSTGNGGGPNTRLTDVWNSKAGKDVQIKDEVKLPGGVVITVIGRWSKHRKDGSLIPMVTGRIVSGAPDGKKKGDRHNAIAAEATHVAKK